MTHIATTPARTAAVEAHERKVATVVELHCDFCQNTYGIGPCTASGTVGSECYNTYFTCQDKPNYLRSTKITRFVNRGVSPPAEGIIEEYVEDDYVEDNYVGAESTPLRPYLTGTANAPVTIDIEAGLASRSNVTLTLADETDNDADSDPYFATRLMAPGGTYWGRWLARNKNYYGRVAKLRRGFAASPWNFDLFIDEQYVISNIALDSSGSVKITLKDPIKLADNSKVPLPTSGELTTVLDDYANVGVALAGSTATTINLANTASAVDGAYVGMEVYIYADTGAGQRRVITAYVGATRTATVATWSVTPDATSAYQVSGLQITLNSGSGAQYADPATSGKNEYVRINSEIIRYTAKVGDVLSWPDSTYRAQFGTARGKHSTTDSAQLCRAYIDKPVDQVLSDLLTQSGIAANYISSSFAATAAAWYGAAFNITACLSAPEKASDLIGEILREIGAVAWWSPHTQKIEMKAIQPEAGETHSWGDNSEIIFNSLSVKIMDDLRITQAAISYDLRDATESLSSSRNFRHTDVVVNLNAQSKNEYGDVRPAVITSRWFGVANSTAMVSAASRKVSRLYHAPKIFSFKLDPKNHTILLGSYVNISSYKYIGPTGTPKIELCMITKLVDAGTHTEVEARSLNFAGRYGYVAPPGTANYPTNTTYAHIAGTNDKMGNGDEPYLTI